MYLLPCVLFQVKQTFFKAVVAFKKAVFKCTFCRASFLPRVTGAPNTCGTTHENHNLCNHLESPRPQDHAQMIERKQLYQVAVYDQTHPYFFRLVSNLGPSLLFRSTWKMLLNFRNGLDVFSIFSLFLKLFGMKSMQNLEKQI